MNMLKRTNEIIFRNKLAYKYKHRFKSTDAAVYYSALNKSIQLEDATPVLNSFKANGIRTEYIHKEFWEYLITVAKMSNEEIRALNQQYATFSTAWFNEILQPWELIHIYMLMLRCGLFTDGLKLRNIALTRTLASSKSDNASYYEKLSALIELNDTEKAKQLLYKTKLFSNTYMYKYYLSLLLQSYNFATRKDIPNDEVFYEMIRGKTVAIVGPADTTAQDGRDIDDHDIVIKMNYCRKGIGADKHVKGLRCTISNFNLDQLNSYIHSGDQNWPGDIQWVMANNFNSGLKLYNYIKNYSHDKDETDGLRIKPRLKSIRQLPYNTSLMQLQKIILDIARYEPAKIKCFHSDLMLTVNRSKGYIDWENMKKEFLETTSKSHDPVPQLLILKQLYKAKVIEGDPRFEEVMQLTEDEYMNQLQSIYGNVGRIKTIPTHD